MSATSRQLVLTLVTVILTVSAVPAATNTIDADALTPMPEHSRYIVFGGNRPDDGETVDLDPPRFCWSYDPDPAAGDSQMRKFRFQVASDSGFSNLLVDLVTESNSYNFLAPLNVSQAWWRVAYLNYSDESVDQWSPVRTFYIDAGHTDWDRSYLADPNYLSSKANHPRLIYNSSNLASIRTWIAGDSTASDRLDYITGQADSTLQAAWWGNPTDEAESKWHGIRRVVCAWLLTNDSKYLDGGTTIDTLVDLANLYVSSGHSRTDDYDGHAIRSLALCYDWLYNEMTPSQRAEVLAALDHHAYWLVNYWIFRGISSIDGYSGSSIYGYLKANPSLDFTADIVGGGSHWKRGHSHAGDALMDGMFAAYAAYEGSAACRDLLEFGVNYHIGRSYYNGTEQGVHQGLSYSGSAFQDIANTAFVANTVFPDMHFEKNPFLTGVARWFGRMAPVGIKYTYWGDVVYQLGGFSSSTAGFGEVIGLMCQDGLVYNRWINEVGSASYVRMARKYFYQDIVQPWYNSPPTTEEETTKGAVYPAEGYATAASFPPSTTAAYEDGVGFTFKCSPRHHADHDNFHNLSFQLWAYGEGLTRNGHNKDNNTAYTLNTIGHNSLLIDGLTQNQVIEFSHAWDDHFGQMIAFDEGTDYVYACGDATLSYPHHAFPYQRKFGLPIYWVGGGNRDCSHLDRMRRHMIMMRGKYFVIFDECEASQPSKFTWVYHVLDENWTWSDPNVPSFVYDVGNVDVYLKHIGNPSELEIDTWIEDEDDPNHVHVNPITGETFPDSSWTPSTTRLPPAPRKLWISNKTNKTSHTFLTVIYPVDSGGSIPTINRIDDLTVEVICGDDHDTITFNSLHAADATLFVDLDALEGSGNVTPSVDAGSDDECTLPTDSVALDGAVSDDGLPASPGAVTTTWSKMSGPGTVTFDDSSAVDTTATFSAAGVYVLRLEAGDGDKTGHDDVIITVNAQAASNTAPTADAGSDGSISLPNYVSLDGTVSDDGLPVNPGAVTTTWSEVSGPGTVTFGDSSAVDTTAGFSETGTYVLKLEAHDGEMSDEDTVQIVVSESGTYYVSPTGSSQNPGTQQSPWSLAKANSTAVAGDTIILLDGDYTGSIDPANEGVSGSPITFQAYTQHGAQFPNVQFPVDLDTGKSYIVIDGLKATNNYKWVRAWGTDHITVKNCYFQDANGWETMTFRDSGGYIRVTGCHIEDGTDSLHIRSGQGHYVANNTFVNASHTCLVIMGVTNSVVQNNTLTNVGQKCMEVMSTREVYNPEEKAEYNLIQNNYFYSSNNSGIQYSGNRSIIRNNIFDGSYTGLYLAHYYGSSSGDRPEAWWVEENRIYNNVFYGCDTGIWAVRIKFVIDDHGGACQDNVHLNNIIYNGSTAKQVSIDWDGVPEQIGFYYNDILRTSSGQDVFFWYDKPGADDYFTLAEIEADYPTYYDNNIESNPNFVDAANDDFELQSNSPCIDAGGPLTHTNGGGTGTVITVDDALYFTDGYGLVDPDVIRIGDDTCTVADVDYGNNQITVADSITWVDNDSVWTDYNGAAPDMGAFEYDSGTPSNTAPTVAAGADDECTLPAGVSLDGTVSDDGLPASPGSVTTTWSKVSGPGTVTFANASAVDTTATFSSDGTYVLRLAGDDGELSDTDDVTITVNPQPNQAPSANAGSDAEIELNEHASLDGTVSDDGLPDPPGTLTTTWSKLSGPGTITFGSTSAVDTTAGFSEAGTYVLKLEASDGSLSDDDTLQIIVEVAGTGAFIEEGGTVVMEAENYDENDTNGDNAGWWVEGSSTSGYVDDGYMSGQVGWTENWSSGAQLGYDIDFTNAGTYTIWMRVWSEDGNRNSCYVGLDGTQTGTGEFDNTANYGTWYWHNHNTDVYISAVNHDFNIRRRERGYLVDRIILTTDTSYTPSGTGLAESARSGANAVPITNAGSDDLITLPGYATLDGTVSDDGLPDPPGSLTTTWSKVSGPGTVTFGSASSVDTTAGFSAIGTYVLKLEASDGSLSDDDTVQITVDHLAPTADAGNDDAIKLPNTVSLDGTVSDDGYPADPGAVTTTWSKVSGPGTVTFGDSSAVDTTAGFSEIGTYVLKLEVSDGDESDEDTVLITANHLAPLVDAGAADECTLPDGVGLDGTVSDDGYPAEPGSLSTTWSKASGPGTVTFDNASAVDTTATFSEDGVYVLKLEASDGDKSGEDTVTMTVHHLAPTVDAGSDDTCTSPSDIASLDGTVSDDGYPLSPGSVTTTWSKVSGPGTVTFGDASAVDTTAGFADSGVHVLMLTASDGELTDSDTVTITVGHQAPTVDAGADDECTLPDGVTLDASASDDGFPLDPGSLACTWTKTSGPGTVTFGDQFAVDTTADFSMAGTYVLRLTASDGDKSGYDEVTIAVNAPNDAPTVDAGDDGTVTLPLYASLDGTVSDDGQPANPGFVTTTWTKQSGPGTVTFGDAASADTTAGFSEAGTYVLRLTADDGALSDYDDVTISVAQASGEAVTYFYDNFNDNNLDDWTTLEGNFETFQFLQESGYEVHALASGSRMSANLYSTNLPDTVYIEFDIRHTDATTAMGWKSGRVFFVDDDGTGFGLYFALDQTTGSNGALELVSTDDDGNTESYDDYFSDPGDPNGIDAKHVKLIYDRVNDELECIYDSTSKGTVSVDSAYRDFTNVVVNLQNYYDGYWGQLDIDNIYVYGAVANDGPTADAGSDDSITLPSSASLDGTVSDDGLPSTPGAVTTTWSKTSGPGTVTFGDSSAVDTTAGFSEDGVYVLQLEVSDGDLSDSDTVQITVDHLAPTADAGADDECTLPSGVTLDGTVSDDGLPLSPGSLTTTWTKQSGPGTVTFGDSTAVDTTAGFSEAGTYVLRLTADDGDKTDYDELTVTVNLAGGPLLSDDFSDNDISDWSTVSGSGWSAANGEATKIADTSTNAAIEKGGFSVDSGTVTLEFDLTVSGDWRPGNAGLVDADGDGIWLACYVGDDYVEIGARNTTDNALTGTGGGITDATADASSGITILYKVNLDTGQVKGYIDDVLKHTETLSLSGVGDITHVVFQAKKYWHLDNVVVDEE